MKPLERLTHRVSVRSGTIVCAAIVVLALSSTSARRVGLSVNAASVVGVPLAAPAAAEAIDTIRPFRVNVPGPDPADLRLHRQGVLDRVNVQEQKRGLMTSSKLERAVLAGGCFWGMQDLIRKLPGVVHTRVGYTGGDVPNATYRNHGSHAEAIEIEFDPARISYRDVLELFFQIHDPTTLNRQGNDVGTSYRSEIFYVSEAQRDEALRTIDDVNASGLWPGRVVTKVSPAGDFWTAEPEHQDYLERYPNGYTCHFPRPGWKLPRRTVVAR
jgi:peptide-methionine (S)-S-oxide reductase